MALKKKQRGENNKNSLKDSCPPEKKKAGQSPPCVISHNKIFKNSLYRGLSSVIITLIYGKETTKIYIYVYFRMYMPCVCVYIYILASIISSLCVAKTKEASQSARQTAEGEEHLIPVTPLPNCGRKKSKYKWKKIKTFFVCMYKFASCFQYK